MLPRFRSRSVRKIRTSSKKFPFHYERRKGRTACCALCGVKLNIKRNGAKSKRIPSRPFGGVLCSKCSFDVMKLAGKVMGAHIKLEDVDSERRKFVRQIK
jgi:ribosomal protein L34E